MPLKRPCLDCGQLSTGSRCPTHDRANHARAYGGNWRALSRAQRQRVPWCQCPGCDGHAGLCKATTDLTTDHLIPHARGGTAGDGVRTLCRRCNSARRDRV